jgi:hypothetical protein
VTRDDSKWKKPEDDIAWLEDEHDDLASNAD